MEQIQSLASSLIDVLDGEESDEDANRKLEKSSEADRASWATSRKAFVKFGVRQSS